MALPFRSSAWPCVAALFTACFVSHVGACQHDVHRSQVKSEKTPGHPAPISPDIPLEIPYDSQADTGSSFAMGRLRGGMPRGGRDVKAGRGDEKVRFGAYRAASRHGRGTRRASPSYLEMTTLSRSQVDDISPSSTTFLGALTRSQERNLTRKIAIATHKQALEAALQKHCVWPHHDVAISYARLGNAYFANGEPQRAMQYFEKALEVRNKLYDNQGARKKKLDNLNFLLKQLAEQVDRCDLENDAELGQLVTTIQALQTSISYVGKVSPEVLSPERSKIDDQLRAIFGLAYCMKDMEIGRSLVWAIETLRQNLAKVTQLSASVATSQSTHYSGEQHTARSITALVDAWNSDSISSKEHKALQANAERLAMVKACIKRFQAASVKELQLADILEYSVLAGIKPDSATTIPHSVTASGQSLGQKMRETLREYLRTWREKLQRCKDHKQTRKFIKGLGCVLRMIDRSVFMDEGISWSSTGQLMELGTVLLKQLPKKATEYTSASYHQHAPTLIALHHLLLKLREVTSTHKLDAAPWAAMRKGVQAALTRLATCTYYPYVYQSELLKASFVNLTTKRPCAAGWAYTRFLYPSFHSNISIKQGIGSMLMAAADASKIELGVCSAIDAVICEEQALATLNKGEEYLAGKQEAFEALQSFFGIAKPDKKKSTVFKAPCLQQLATLLEDDMQKQDPSHGFIPDASSNPLSPRRLGGRIRQAFTAIRKAVWPSKQVSKQAKLGTDIQKRWQEALETMLDKQPTPSAHSPEQVALLSLLREIVANSDQTYSKVAQIRAKALLKRRTKTATRQGNATQWYNHLHTLTFATLCMLQDPEKNYGKFVHCLNTFKDNIRQVKNKNIRRALGYGLITQIGILASQSSHLVVQYRMLKMLELLLTSSRSRVIETKDPVLVRRILECIAEVAGSELPSSSVAQAILARLFSGCTDSQQLQNSAPAATIVSESKRAIRQAKRSRRLVYRQSAPYAFAKEELMQIFLKTHGNLSEYIKQIKQRNKKTIQQDVSSALWDRPLPTQWFGQVRQRAGVYPHQEVRAHYQSAFYGTVKPVFAQAQPCAGWPMREACIQLTFRSGSPRQAAQAEVKASQALHDSQITLDRLFDNARQVVLLGLPGTGKTTLCQKIAHLWAQGSLYKDQFEAVYVLPVSALREDYYDDTSLRRRDTLVAAIANLCFPASEDDKVFEARYNHISQQLIQRPQRILLILDGLDERTGASERIIESVLKHKAAYSLCTARSASFDSKHLSGVDLVVENLGFSNRDVVAYIQRFFGKDARRAAALIAFLQHRDMLQAMAHTPVHLQILCTLWQGERGRRVLQNRQVVQQTKLRENLTTLYEELMKSLWEHCNHKFAETQGQQLTSEERDKLYEVLENLAFVALVKGEVTLTDSMVREAFAQIDWGQSRYDERRIREIFEQSGCLHELAPMAQSKRCFLHLTLQEYLAGCKLARDLLATLQETAGAAAVGTKAVQLIQALGASKQHGHGQRYFEMLTYLVGKLCQDNVHGAQAVKMLLQALQTKKEQAADLENLLLQLRCLNACMGICPAAFVKGPAPETKTHASLLSQGQTWSGALMEEYATLSQSLKATIKTALSTAGRAQHGVEQMHLVNAFARMNHLLPHAKIAEYYLAQSEEHSQLSANPEAIRMLAAVLSAYTDKALEQLIAWCQQHHPSQLRTVARSLAWLVTDPRVTSHRREIAIQQLGAMATTPAGSAGEAPVVDKSVFEALQTSANPEVRLATADVLGKLARTKATCKQLFLSHASNACRDTDKAVRQAAAARLVELAIEDPKTALAHLGPLAVAWSRLDAVIQKVPQASVQRLRTAVARSVAATTEDILKTFDQADPLRRIVKTLSNACINKFGSIAADENVQKALGKVRAALQALQSQADSASPGDKAIFENQRQQLQSATVRMLTTAVSAAAALAYRAVEPLQQACQSNTPRPGQVATATRALIVLAQVMPTAATRDALLQRGIASRRTAADRKEVKRNATANMAAGQALGALVNTSSSHIPDVAAAMLSAYKQQLPRAAASPFWRTLMMTTTPAHAEAIGAACTNTLLAERSTDLLDKMMYQHRYSSAYRAMFVGMVGAWYKHTPAQAITELLSKDKWPIEALGLQHLLLQLRCMNQCISLTPDQAAQAQIKQQYAPLIQALFKWIRVVKSHGQEQGLRQILLETNKDHFNHIIAPEAFDKMCAQTPQDSKAHARLHTEALERQGGYTPSQIRAVLENFFQVLGISYEAKESTPSLIKRMLRNNPALASSTINVLTTSSEEPGWRPSAAKSLGELVEEAPERAEEVLKRLLALCKDPDTRVCANAILSLSKVVQASPAHAKDVFEVLLAFYNDRGAPSAVQTAAAIALGTVLKVTRAYTKDILKAFTHALDQSVAFPVRIATILALGEAAQADADQAKHILKVLITTLKKASYAPVRAAVAFVLGEVGKAAPACASVGLKVLLVACTDTDAETRIAAAHAFRKIMQAAPQAAERVFRRYATREFIEIYCHNAHMREVLFPRLLHRLLYTEALVIGQDKLTLHQAAGTRTWDMSTLPKKDFEAFKWDFVGQFVFAK